MLSDNCHISALSDVLLLSIFKRLELHRLKAAQGVAEQFRPSHVITL